MEFKELIAEFAARVGVTESVVIDDENRCAFEIDGMGVIAQGLDEVGVVSLLAFIAPPPPERLERLYRRLLEANHLYRETFGATLSVDPRTGSVRLCRCVPYPALGGDRLEALVLGFITALADWRRRVRDFRPEETAVEGDDAPDDQAVVIKG